MIRAGVQGRLIHDWAVAVRYATWLASTTGRRRRVRLIWGTHWHVTEVDSPTQTPPGVSVVVASGGNGVLGRATPVAAEYPHVHRVAS